MLNTCLGALKLLNLVIFKFYFMEITVNFYLMDKKSLNELLLKISEEEKNSEDPRITTLDDVKSFVVRSGFVDQDMVPCGSKIGCVKC